MSGCIASRLSAVSASVSPLTTLEVAIATLSVSALSRFSAISNEVRVRVLGSKNRLTTVLPRSAGTFLIGREPISFIATAVSRTSAISCGVMSAMPSRCWLRSAVTAAGASTSVFMGAFIRHLLAEHDFVLAVGLLQPHLDALLRARSGRFLPT